MSENNEKIFEVKAIGEVRRMEDGICLEIAEPYRLAMTGLEKFSHVHVLFWANQLDGKAERETIIVDLPYAPGVIHGVFACRAPIRPNPILITVCSIEGIDMDKGVLMLGNLDALEGTPVLDVKAYFPVTDRVKEAVVPEFAREWGEWLPEEGVGLMPHEL